MHDIDAKINQISGQQNYMEQLAKVTGDMFTIDREMYHTAIDKCSKCDFNLKILSNRFIASGQLDEQSLKLFNDFLVAKEAFDIATKTFYMEERKSKKSKKVKPPREVVDFKHKPQEVFKSDWFKCVRAIEKMSHSYLNTVLGKGAFNIDSFNADQFTEALTKQPDLEAISRFGGIHIKLEDTAMYINVANAYKCSKIIINEFMNPMYDIRATIIRNHAIIDKVFKTPNLKETLSEGNINTPEDVIDILEKFIIAKYRATISGNNKHYIKLFTSMIDPNSSAAMEGSKFLDIMESLNLDQLDKNANTYKFAMGAKTVINQIVSNGSLDSEEIIEKINEIFATGEQEEEPKPEVHEDAKQFDDLL